MVAQHLPDTSRRAYQRWIESELLPNQQPPSYLEWVEIALQAFVVRLPSELSKPSSDSASIDAL